MKLREIIEEIYEEINGKEFYKDEDKFIEKVELYFMDRFLNRQEGYEVTYLDDYLNDGSTVKDVLGEKIFNSLKNKKYLTKNGFTYSLIDDFKKILEDNYI